MNNNTKIRLHLSKNLFESIAKEVLTEAKKANDGYTVAVKQPKQPKQSKDQAKAPEVQKTDAEATMGEVHAQADTKKMAKTKEAIDFDKAHDYTYRLVDGNCTRINPETGERTKVHHTYCNDLKREMETKVAEEGKLKEFTGSETEMSAVYTMLATALGVGVPLAAAVIKDLRKAKTPEEKKKVLQSMASQIDKSKGVSEDKNTLKEYEHHYEMVNGQCRRYNDEGEYTVVSSHYCR